MLKTTNNSKNFLKFHIIFGEILDTLNFYKNIFGRKKLSGQMDTLFLLLDMRQKKLLENT